MLRSTPNSGVASAEIAGRAPRRLTRAARHEQLVAAAMPVVAAQGFSGFSLDEVAVKADVTRNLLYHYFPRGRADVVLAVAEAAGHRLTDDWLTDEAIPLAERLAANNTRMIEHAMKPSDAWTIYQLARGANDPELRETVDRFVGIVISATSLNQLGTADPPPLVRLTLKGYLAFFGAVLDEARTTATPPGQVLNVLNQTLVAALRAAT
jgi:AcrR family transcriptional regulator